MQPPLCPERQRVDDDIEGRGARSDRAKNFVERVGMADSVCEIHGESIRFYQRYSSDALGIKARENPIELSSQPPRH